MPIDLKSAIINLHEDISLTDELTDTPAVMLLKWGEEKLKAFAQEIDDQEAFDEKFKALRGLMKSMNRFTGRRLDMDDTEQLGYVYKIVESSAALGLGSAHAKVGTYIKEQVNLDEIQNVEAMIALVENRPEAEVIDPGIDPDETDSKTDSTALDDPGVDTDEIDRIDLDIDGPFFTE